ncbi:NUDIX hydrolase domain-like protein [Biscogniauxia sp. FL1348]|nr:NUDIX hydrolase domain-like protein [Biscogniauxia sp. FL1348]
MSDTTPHPRVGVAAIIRNAAGQLVVGQRAGSHGAGTWQFPGGHLEMGESLPGCAERETLEETGLRVSGVRVAAATNDVFPAEGEGEGKGKDAKHYVTVFVECAMLDPGAQPEVMEPNKCLGWRWMAWDELHTWCAHHDDDGPEWADKKVFLPIRDLAKDHPELDFLAK